MWKFRSPSRKIIRIVMVLVLIMDIDLVLVMFVSGSGYGRMVVWSYGRMVLVIVIVIENIRFWLLLSLSYGRIVMVLHNFGCSNVDGVGNGYSPGSGSESNSSYAMMDSHGL